MEISSELLKILCCPVTKSKKLKYNKASQEIICEEAGLAYPVIEGIPIMLPEEAREIDSKKAKKIA